MDREKLSKIHRGPAIDASRLISKKSSPLKLFGQMNRNLMGSIYGRSYLDKLLKRRRFLEIDQSETRTACANHVC
jgi:hypothetical protein